MIKCEYCGRTSLELKSNCDGCGAPLDSLNAPAFYNPRYIDRRDFSKDLIPVNVGEHGRISDVFSIYATREQMASLCGIQPVLMGRPE